LIDQEPRTEETRAKERIQRRKEYKKNYKGRSDNGTPFVIYNLNFL